MGIGADEVPRQGREPGGQARRAAARRAGARARLPPSAPGGAAVGRGPGHLGEAPRTRHHDRRGGGGAGRAGARGDRGRGVGPSPARPGAQPGSAARAAGTSPAVDRDPTCARPAPKVVRGARHRPGRAHRPAGEAAPRRASRLPDDHAPAPLRRLHAGDALAHRPRGDGRDRGRPRDGEGAPGVGGAADQGAWDHADRAQLRQPLRRPGDPAGVAPGRRRARRPRCGPRRGEGAVRLEGDRTRRAPRPWRRVSVPILPDEDL